jgi:RNA polymerase sigma-70 factor (ECF subfamily)
MTDAARFEAFVREFQDMVYAVAVRLLANPTEAEDVSQTVFLKAYERFGELDANPAAPGWLKTVATNISLNHLSRYRARWRFFSELGSDEQESRSGERGLESTLADGGAGPDEPLQLRERDAALEAALHRLPDHQRVPLVLYHFEDKSYQEIAALLGVSLAKLKTDIFRGRETLRRVLTDHGAI